MKTLRIGFVVYLTLVIFGCPLDQIGGGKNIDDYDRTPAGWRVEWQDQGTIASGRHTKAEVYAYFDAAMVRAAHEVEDVHGIPWISVLGRAKDAGAFILVDHWHFPAFGNVIDFPGTQYATGEIDQGSNITVAFYLKAGGASQDAALIPATAPPWTYYTGPITGNWYWGEEQAGAWFPALGYELGHEWGF